MRLFVAGGRTFRIGQEHLASAYLVEAARLGEAGVIAAFAQRPNHSRGRLLAELIQSDCVAVVDTQSPPLSIDEIFLLLMAEIR